MSRSRGRRAAAAALAVAALCYGTAASAQDNVAGAANAFSRAQKAALAGDYAQAAELFELADSLAPTPEALRSALSARKAQGQLATAASHAEELLRRYPDDAESRTLASETLDEVKQSHSRQEVSCSPDPCLLLIDGAAAGADPKPRHVVYLKPGTHELVAVFGERRTEPQSVESVAGKRENMRFTAPPASASSESAAGPSASSDDPAVDRGTEGGGLSPWFFGVSAGVTVALAGVAVWSGLDTLSAHDDYEQNQTQEGYEEGQDLELRTNVLIGATAVAAAATVTFAIFTDWSGGKRAEVGAGMVGQSPGLVLRGVF